MRESVTASIDQPRSSFNSSCNSPLDEIHQAKALSKYLNSARILPSVVFIGCSAVARQSVKRHFLATARGCCRGQDELEGYVYTRCTIEYRGSVV